jgi:hypothetical protein
MRCIIYVVLQYCVSFYEQEEEASDISLFDSFEFFIGTIVRTIAPHCLLYIAYYSLRLPLEWEPPLC